MSSLSSYLDILRQTRADELRLAPGEPVAVLVAGRAPAQGGAPVSAAALQTLAQELLTPRELRELTAIRPHRSTQEHDGVEYAVEFSRRGSELVVSLRPVGRASRAPESTPSSARPLSARAVEPTAFAGPSRPVVGAAAVATPAPPARPVVVAPTPAAPIPAPSPAPSSRLEPPSTPPAAAPPAGAPGPSFARAATALASQPAVPAFNTSGKRIDELLLAMLAKRASDLHLSSQNHPIVRVDGEIIYLTDRPVLGSEDIQALALEVMTEKAQRDFSELRDADCAYEIPGVARFRVNVFEDRKGVGVVLRQIPITIIPAEQLGLPKACFDLCHLSKGLVVVTGPTGSGKSTTLAAMIDHINKTRSEHIITIEDPVEFVHPNIKCLINQREVGNHTKSFKSALRAALREDPDIVLVGEMRDLETIAIAIETAETGHLVFGTLHTTTATSTVDRMIDQFPSDRQAQIRVMLSESLKGVIAQVLCKKIGGGRVAAQEVLLGNNAVSSLIREGKTFQLANVMQTAKAQGMVTMNDALFSLVQRELVEPSEAYLKAVDKPGLLAMIKNAGISMDPP